MSSLKQILFGERAAGVYLKSEIFFPNEYQDDVIPEESGKIIPAVGSLIIDDTKGLHNQVYVVTAVDQETYNPALIPATYVVDSTAQVDRVLSYGNDLFFLYFNTVTISVSGSNINLTRLIIDNKLSLFGNHAAQYQLFRTKSDGTEEVISRWYVNNKYAGTVCDMLETGVNGIRKCDGCYTDVKDLYEGDLITLKVYTAGGLMIAAIQLVAKEAYLLNEFASNANPIVAMSIDANQIDDDGNLFLYQHQNTEELAIFVLLKYSDGTIRRIAIDNVRGFCYGLEQISSATSGVEYQIVVKYYLSDADILGETIPEMASRLIIKKCQQLLNNEEVTRDNVIVFNDSLQPENSFNHKPALEDFIRRTFGVTIPSDNTYRTIGDYIDTVVNSIANNEAEIGQYKRYMVEYVPVKIISYEDEIISKISPIPRWDSSNAKWYLSFVQYCTNRSDSTIINNVGSVNCPITITNNSFVGNKFDEEQTVTIEGIEYIRGIKTTYHQSFLIKLRNRSAVKVDENDVDYLIRDEADSPLIYGENSINHKRPVIYYSSTSRTYKIPSSIFSASSIINAVDVFLENFYNRANPPMIGTETKAPTPTHFTVKDPTTKMSLLNEYLAIGSFDSVLMTDNGDSKYVGNTLIVEFYRYIDSTSSYETLYGVPVDVVNE